MLDNCVRCRVAAGDVEYVAGRESVAHYNESLAGARQVRCICALSKSCGLNGAIGDARTVVAAT